MRFVVFVEADPTCRDAIVVTKFRGLPSVFGSDQIDVFQDPNSPIGDVFEIADRCGDKIKRAG